MRGLACFLLCLTAAGCVLEDRPVGGDGGTGGGDGGPFCVNCEGATPVCNQSTGVCVQCTPEEAGECGGATPLCDPVLSECVACVGDADCDDPTAAKCDDESKECVPCDDRAQCDDVEGLPGTANACNADGECVECTPDSEIDTCAGGVSCNPATETCTTTERGSRAECQTCVADSECGDQGAPSEDFRCVPMFYPDASTRFPDADTGFCLKIFEPGGCRQPYAITITDRSSLSDPTLRSYCGINELLVTCTAVRALELNQECPGGDDGECPTGGLCRDVGGLPDRCTYLCGLPAQCPPDPPANTCGASGGGGDDFCGG